MLDRDLPALMDRLTTSDGVPLLDAVESLAGSHHLPVTLPGVYPAAPLRQVERADVPLVLGFQANPTA